MKPFLKQVADHYHDSGSLAGRSFIFPNRRSMVFFKKYLSEAVARSATAPLRVPRMMTINDFFHETLGMYPTDKVRLLLALYESYSEVNPGHEPLDEFIFWGDVILGDFDIHQYQGL